MVLFKIAEKNNYKLKYYFPPLTPAHRVVKIQLQTTYGKVMAIKFYKTNDPYGFLNNFKKARMFFCGRWWNNVESAYQAAKTTTKEDEDLIWTAATPREARDLGQKVKLRPDWEDVKDDVMYECILAKFVQHHDLREKLIATGEEELIEDSPIDYYWGCGKDGTGKNMLGKTLMRVRKDLKEQV